MRFWGSEFIQNVKTWEELRNWSTRNFTSINQIFKNGISLRDNVFCKIISQVVDVNTAITTGTDLRVTHNLGVIPIGFVYIKCSKTVSPIPGATAWTAQDIYINFGSTSGSFTIVVYGG